jgi:mannitol/fructose-specific phosphotransferase system IIA component (Ntr-type)
LPRGQAGVGEAGTNTSIAGPAPVRRGYAVLPGRGRAEVGMALQRKLGMWHVFCIASGAMISSGLFVLPGQAFKIAGPAMVLAYAAAALTGRLGVDEQVILAKLRAREADSGTVLQPGLAIPHIVVDGKGVFEILPVRCREGIIFDPQKPPVRTAFILAGSPDERNYHLRALMAIAHIVQEHHFTDRWQAAAGPEALRDILLLSGRKRDATA